MLKFSVSMRFAIGEKVQDGPNLQSEVGIIALLDSSMQVRFAALSQVSELPVSITTLKAWPPIVMGARKTEPPSTPRSEVLSGQ